MGTIDVNVTRAVKYAGSIKEHASGFDNIRSVSKNGYTNYGFLQDAIELFADMKAMMEQYGSVCERDADNIIKAARLYVKEDQRIKGVFEQYGALSDRGNLHCGK